ncbi:hypothetical protein Tco_0049754 [Tanacetum coccineum]
MSYNEKTGVYSCQVDEQWFDLSADLLRKALAITPVNPTHTFELPPSGDTVIDCRIRTSMDVVITCQVVDYHFGKPSIRDEERRYFLLWVLQTGFVACFVTRCLGLSLPEVFPVKHWLSKDRIALQG